LANPGITDLSTKTAQKILLDDYRQNLAYRQQLLVTKISHRKRGNAEHQLFPICRCFQAIQEKSA
jgi:hypothetical protein